MKTILTNALLSLLLSLAHSWAYWCALSNDISDAKTFSNWLPFLLIVASIAFPAVALNALIAFALQQKFNLSEKNVLISYGLIYLLWGVSACALYFLNAGMDAYSASLGVLFYVPLHAGIFFAGIFIVNLIFSYFVKVNKN